TVTPGVPVNVVFSPPYDDGSIVTWTTTSNTPDLRGVIKVDHVTGEIIDTFIPAERGLDPPEFVALLSGNYKMLDRDNRLIVGYSSRLEVYGDDFPADPASPIELLDTYPLPSDALCRADDSLVGLVMTYDGRIAFATDMGMIGFMPGEPSEMSDEALAVASLNGEKCGDESIPVEELEHVTNSIAADETGGVYAVTDERLLGFSASGLGGEVAIDWSATYETGDALSAVRIGDAGSGSTPTVMGTSEGDDRFVVITDGQDVMHLVLYWLDEIPADWEPVEPGKDPRIACEVPVTFGETDVSNSETEQSVLVHGYSSILTNNRLDDAAGIGELPENLRRGSAALLGGDPEFAPRGAERIDWDPGTRTCSTVWTNAEVSIPNGVPTMSAPSNMVYGMGLDGSTWGLVGLDFGTGEQVFFAPGAGGEECKDAQLSQFPDAASSVFEPYFDQLPTSCDNSFYSSTLVGPDQVIYSGHFGAMTRFVPDDAAG
ncbi:MAG: hypothetical protein ACERLM_09810, partial [Acidimicrobiales bacterium]